jgi:release factor glutamine methyltransferase
VADLDARAVERRLAAAGCVAADEEAPELVHAAPDARTLERWVVRREDGEPLAWIVGSISFGGIEVHVDSGVYVPRVQTVPLARRAARRVPSGGRVADLCTGSGAVAAWIASSDVRPAVVASDVDPVAIACARRNGVHAVVGDLDAPFASGAIDVVTAVAPYVPTDELGFLPRDVTRFEPLCALDGGDGDGLFIVRRVVRGAARLLAPGGWLLVELGGDQDHRLTPDLEANGFGMPTPWFDDDGDLRGLEAQLLSG